MTTIVVALFVLILDLGSKSLASSGLIAAPWIEPSVNPDLALGVLGGPAAAEVVAAAIALVLGAIALRRGPRGPLAAIALGLVIGASLGNLIDRIAFGAVRDFIVGPHVLFNLADVALVVGLGGFAVAAAVARRDGYELSRTEARA